jgi:hypothetical protein
MILADFSKVIEIWTTSVLTFVPKKLTTIIVCYPSRIVCIFWNNPKENEEKYQNMQFYFMDFFYFY